ncbi:C6 finger domain containing protein [Colletotrichum sojae]|uniref:C6 finger domain containing protein n=1 Tax=Colletotrichum sojae TaxID=2175907 RepID=A0A8H6IS65_9PEZI|nr:C6 finger domain containing protein [Colletotrichum sojae]
MREMYGQVIGLSQASRGDLPVLTTSPEPRALGGAAGNVGQRPINLVIPDTRRRQLLGFAPDNPITGPVAMHIMHLVIRHLKSWPRLMAVHRTHHLPPVIHRLQLLGDMPVQLANCYALVNMWADHTAASAKLYHTYDELGLLCAGQSLLMLMIVVFLCDQNSASTGRDPDPAEAHILISVWNLKHRLAMTGLVLDAEFNNNMPEWGDWAMAEAKRRTVLSLHHLEWVWSLLHGYPILTCFELGPLPAPGAGYLWSARDEQAWRRQYESWLVFWKDGSFKISEFFHMNADSPLSARAETWLAESDAFGALLMSEIKAVGD